MLRVQRDVHVIHVQQGHVDECAKNRFLFELYEKKQSIIKQSNNHKQTKKQTFPSIS